MSEQHGDDIAQYRTDSVADLADLLRRAEQFHEAYHHEVVAAEFRDAREFVEAELVAPEEARGASNALEEQQQTHEA